jgi:hypothetical protein
MNVWNSQPAGICKQVLAGAKVNPLHGSAKGHTRGARQSADGRYQAVRCSPHGGRIQQFHRWLGFKDLAQDDLGRTRKVRSERQNASVPDGTGWWRWENQPAKLNKRALSDDSIHIEC